MLAPITVNSHLDNTIFGDGLITLREAIIAANETIEHDTIDFAHGLNGATIRLQYFGQQNAALSIGRDVTIDATMLPLGITLDALDTEIDPTIPGDQDGLRIFDIGGAETFNLSVTLAGLKLTGGNPIFGGPGAIAYQAETGMLTIRDCKIVGNFGFGAGAISASVGSTGTTNGVRIERTEISGNTSVSGQTYGAGIFASVRNGSFDIIDSTISGNEGLGSFSKGGGVYGRLEGNSTMTIDRTVISDNTTYGQGGGFFVLLAGPDNGKFVLSDSTVSGNHALHNVGGGGYVCQKFGGEFEAINSTISGNDALHATYGRGGGLAIARETNAPAIDSHLDHLTITNNKATSGGGLYSTDDALVHTYVNHTIISGNRNAAGQPNNVGGDIENDSSYNLLGSGGSADISPQTLGPGNTFDDDPKLGPLTNNGGPTLTHMPQFGSLAIDAGDPNALAGQNGVPTYDQRGAPHNRVVNLLEAENGPANETNVIDIGAVEVKRPSDPLYNVVGDYNRNGFVDAADYTSWLDRLGLSFTLPNEDPNVTPGMVTAEDYQVWVDHFGETGGSGGGSLAYVSADFDHNQIVDDDDFAIWESTFGSTTDLRADANGNGIIDLADLEVWQYMRRATTLDSLSAFGDLNDDHMIDSADMALAQTSEEIALVTANFGMVRADMHPQVVNGTDGMPKNLLGIAPLVIAVSVGTSGFGGVVGSGEQIRSITAATPNSISIRFSEEVLVTSGALQVINLDGASPGTPVSFTYNLSTQTVTWTYGSALADGRYVLRLADSVFDLSHDALDGEFTNPWTLAASGSSVFPSGDGEAGGEFRFRFTVLFGDTDHDNIYEAANYVNWQSYEPGMIYVSTTADEFDGDLGFGDVSLREAVDHANTASEPTTIVLPAGHYALTRNGTEGTGTAYNDLDVTGAVTILGDGPGVSVIESGWVDWWTFDDKRLFELKPSARLTLRGVTLANMATNINYSGAAVLAWDRATLEIIDSAIVNNTINDTRMTVHSIGADTTILRSVFTGNDGYDGEAVLAQPWPIPATYYAGSLTIGESIFALNTNYASPSHDDDPNVRVIGDVVLVNLGKNLYDNANGGFFDVVPGEGDYLGTPDYVVTNVADSFDHTNNAESLSIREAVDLANQASGTQEIWIPAWNFVLTRDRGSATSDVDTAIGDIDVKDSVVIRGVAGRTTVSWAFGIVDEVFDLVGDFNSDGQADYGIVSSADYTIWQDQNGSNGEYEQFSADADDDGDVDEDDYDIWVENFGHTLELLDVQT